MEPVMSINPALFAGYTGMATVLETEADNRRATVSIDSAEGPSEVRAWLTHPIADQLESGDKVLIISDRAPEFYVIGLLSKSPGAPNNKIRLADGAYACLEKTEAGERLCFFSSANALMFQYDAASGTARISPEAENISFQALNGNIDFIAAQNIRLTSARINLNGKSGIGMSVGDVFERLRSAFTLKPGQLGISGHSLRVSVKSADFFTEEIKAYVKNFSSQIKNFRLIAEKIETAADSIVEKAKNFYRTTENLSQHRAGRIRMLINTSFHLNSKISVLKSKEKVKVDAKKIHLG